ncbi:hypothetical protein L6M84_12350, partial [Klebsiella pneumoniae]|nr:hypothetical protein [Klebsiella pneumoniae]
TPSVAEQEGQQTETEATGAPQKHHYTLNQQVGSITGRTLLHAKVLVWANAQNCGVIYCSYFSLLFITTTSQAPYVAAGTRSVMLRKSLFWRNFPAEKEQ